MSLLQIDDNLVKVGLAQNSKKGHHDFIDHIWVIVLPVERLFLNEVKKYLHLLSKCHPFAELKRDQKKIYGAVCDHMVFFSPQLFFFIILKVICPKLSLGYLLSSGQYDQITYILTGIVKVHTILSTLLRYSPEGLVFSRQC